MKKIKGVSLKDFKKLMNWEYCRVSPMYYPLTVKEFYKLVEKLNKRRIKCLEEQIDD